MPRLPLPSERPKALDLIARKGLRRLNHLVQGADPDQLVEIFKALKIASELPLVPEPKPTDAELAAIAAKEDT